MREFVNGKKTAGERHVLYGITFSTYFMVENTLG